MTGCASNPRADDAGLLGRNVDSLVSATRASPLVAVLELRGRAHSEAMIILKAVICGHLGAGRRLVRVNMLDGLPVDAQQAIERIALDVRELGGRLSVCDRQRNYGARQMGRA